jgi:hypothetical protein
MHLCKGDGGFPDVIVLFTDMRGAWNAALLAVVLTSCLHLIYGASTTNVTTSSNITGMTADYYGVNAGHANPQSNWQMWLDRLEVTQSCKLFSCSSCTRPHQIAFKQSVIHSFTLSVGHCLFAHDPRADGSACFTTYNLKLRRTDLKSFSLCADIRMQIRHFSCSTPFTVKEA